MQMRQNIARDAEILDTARKSKGVGWNDACVRFEMDKGIFIKIFGIDKRIDRDW